jgi:hypothetical protein
LRVLLVAFSAQISFTALQRQQLLQQQQQQQQLPQQGWLSTLKEILRLRSWRHRQALTVDVSKVPTRTTIYLLCLPWASAPLPLASLP